MILENFLQNALLSVLSRVILTPLITPFYPLIPPFITSKKAPILLLKLTYLRFSPRFAPGSPWIRSNDAPLFRPLFGTDGKRLGSKHPWPWDPHCWPQMQRKLCMAMSEKMCGWIFVPKRTESGLIQSPQKPWVCQVSLGLSSQSIYWRMVLAKTIVLCKCLQATLPVVTVFFIMVSLIFWGNETWSILSGKLT